jgi:hypothetical protein
MVMNGMGRLALMWRARISTTLLLTWLAIGAFAGILSAQTVPDAHEIVKRSVERDQMNWSLAREYAFVQRVEERRMSGEGRVTSREVKTYDVTLLEDGGSYRRLVARNDQPLSHQEEAKEQRKLEKSITDQQKMSEREREKRAAKFAKEREETRKFLREVADAYTFKIAGEEVIAGRKTWVIDGTPKPGYRPRDRRAKMLEKFQGRLWINQQDYQWVKVQAEAIDTVSFGLFLARLAKGARVGFEQVRVNDELWMVKDMNVRFAVKLGLIKTVRGEVDIAYSNFRKFTTGARVVSIGEEVK